MKLKFFTSAAGFRTWLEVHHERATELWVGFYKKASGRVGISYDQAVEEALCFGWTDGLKKRMDDLSYTHRFTPRRPHSVWSRINIQRVGRLKRKGRMMAAGLKAFTARDPKRSGIYSFENAARTLSPEDEKQFRADKAAWNFFQQQPPGYRRLAIWLTVRAKQAETRTRRLKQLIHAPHLGRRLRTRTVKK